MRRRLLIVNIGLGLSFVLGMVELIARIQEASERRDALLAPAAPRESPGFPAPEPSARLRPVDFRPIVDRFLFSPDRHPVIEVEEPLQEEYDRPAYPLLVGVMDFGDGPIAMMSETARGTPRPVEVGGKVGEFTFLAASENRVTLEWSGRTLEVAEDELTGAENTRAKTRPGSRIQRSAAARRPTRTVSSTNLGANKPNNVSSKYYIGPPLAGLSGRRKADPDDGVAAGTESDGWVRRVNKTPFGTQHWWEAKQK